MWEYVFVGSCLFKQLFRKFVPVDCDPLLVSFYWFFSGFNFFPSYCFWEKSIFCLSLTIFTSALQDVHSVKSILWLGTCAINKWILGREIQSLKHWEVWVTLLPFSAICLFSTVLFSLTFCRGYLYPCFFLTLYPVCLLGFFIFLC